MLRYFAVTFFLALLYLLPILHATGNGPTAANDRYDGLRSWRLIRIPSYR